MVVLLGGPGDATNAVFHSLAAALEGSARVEAILEEPPSRFALARRRARRLGWTVVAGQVLFVGLTMPFLRLVGRRRIGEIATEAGLDLRPIPAAHHVESVNEPGTVALLGQLAPAVVVVHGTRIIAERVLSSIPAPFVNLHAGLTPRYRGVHGGYWALAEGRRDLTGSTVHLVDTGIDTGGILGQATFVPTGRDSLATYPYLHLACGMPILLDQVSRILAGEPPREVAPLAGAEESRLRWHPTAWGYAAARLRRGLR